jgi:hypothetical protein
MSENGKPVSIKFIQTILGSEPHKSPAVLKDAVNNTD